MGGHAQSPLINGDTFGKVSLENAYLETLNSVLFRQKLSKRGSDSKDSVWYR